MADNVNKILLGEPISSLTKKINTNFTKLDEEVAKKVESKEGFGLSQNDFTNEYKDNLDALVDMKNKDQFGRVDDIQVNGESIVNNKIANIHLTDSLNENRKDKFVSAYVTSELNNNKADRSEIPDISNLASKRELETGLTGKVDKVEGKQLSTNDYTTAEKTKLESLENYDDSGIKAEILTLQTDKASKSEIPDVSLFITRTVADLENYYTKSQTYTKEEINQAISAIPKFKIQAVDSLPTTGMNDTTVYLLKNETTDAENLYEEYIYVNNKWELLGTQKVDLAGYLTIEAFNSAIAGYYTKGQTDELLANKVDKEGNKVLSTNDYTTAEKTKLSGIEDGANKVTKTSQLTNDSGFMTGYTETDPTVPSWAKQETKPTYTASEVGALPSSTVIPSKTSQLTNDSGFLTSAPVTSVNGMTGAVSGLASSSDLANYIPQGGTLSKPLKVTGGDQATAGKIMLDETNKGQITNTSTQTLFGYLDTTQLAVGHTSYKLRLRGNESRAKYNGNDIAILSDLPTNYVTTDTEQTITGAKAFAGQVGNMQTEAGVYLGLDANTGAENANIAITSANTAAYIDMGRPNVDYDFRIIKWNTNDNKHAQLVYGGNAAGTITIPQAYGTMALTSDIPSMTSILNTVYPIGSIYLTVATSTTGTTSPASFLGGTWTLISKDRFLVGAGGSYSGTGGSSTHTHTLGAGYAKIMCEWISSANRWTMEMKTGSQVVGNRTLTGGTYSGTSYTANNATALGGSTDSSSNIPPYQAVYIWQRTG